MQFIGKKKDCPQSKADDLEERRNLMRLFG